MVKTADNLMVRREQWQRLEILLEQTSGRRIRRIQGNVLLELSDLYRSACTDLAMAEQYRLSPETVIYLHGLVGRAHNQIYRSGKFQVRRWNRIVFHDAPKQIFSDPCVHLCAALFFGLFIFSAYVAWDQKRFPGLGEKLLGATQVETLEQMYEEIDFSKPNENASGRLFMVSFYIQHNTGIGLSCFSKGPLVIAGLWETAYQATVLGASFGYMARPETPGGDSFLHFVTAHGPFELTAIVLAAASGLRIGMGWIFTKGLARLASLRVQAVRAIPIMSASGVLFIFAALTEGLLSPSGQPYFFKAIFGMLSSTALMYYFVMLGYPSEAPHGT
ncbi:MAG: stage II sporulation protein M [Pirellulales bacterium]